MSEAIIARNVESVNQTNVRVLAADDYEEIAYRVAVDAKKAAMQYESLEPCLTINDLAVIAVYNACYDVVRVDYRDLNAIQRAKLFWHFVDILTTEKQREVR